MKTAQIVIHNTSQDDGWVSASADMNRETMKTMVQTEDADQEAATAQGNSMLMASQQAKRNSKA